jgi:hypothetical protein
VTIIDRAAVAPARAEGRDQEIEATVVAQPVQGRQVTGDVERQLRLRMAFADNQSDRLVGLAEVVEQLDCPPGPLPSFLSCPNPVTAPAGDWLPEPGGAPNVPLRAWRLTAR